MVKDPGQRRAPVEGPRTGRAPLFWTRLFRKGYLADKDPRDPRISPLYADTSKHSVDTLIFTAEYDVSASETEEYAKNAGETGQAAGRRVILRRMRGCGHGFDKSEKNAGLRAEAYSIVVDLLTRNLDDK
ncbi:hypothetical protein NUW58_g6831 [Xylaria curta]|uniref:Uncharacterized protein n=1 Tax=Xylaria curta TaxID=42375 RepID=A0ACC1NPN3_9PEZI|nr:hypothetical protein NUW58_g6831 [Xylaria curta]